MGTENFKSQVNPKKSQMKQHNQTSAWGGGLPPTQAGRQPPQNFFWGKNVFFVSFFWVLAGRPLPQFFSCRGRGVCMIRGSGMVGVNIPIPPCQHLVNLQSYDGEETDWFICLFLQLMLQATLHSLYRENYDETNYFSLVTHTGSCDVNVRFSLRKTGQLRVLSPYS